MKTIVVTGPESAGKTTLAQDLASSLEGALYVPEFARVYLDAAGSDYTFSDYISMLKGQRAWQEWYGLKQPKYLICDTDYTVFQVWAQEKYGVMPNELYAWKTKHKADLYLLCVPEMPWEPDPLRESPESRERLFEVYLTLLQSEQHRFEIMQGDRATRFSSSVLALRQV